MNSIQSNIKKAKQYLDKNHCIAVPTETVYGLAGNAYSDKATSKIFILKKRPKKNPLIVHYYNLSYLKKDCVINKNFTRLYKKFCPGPISFVLKLKKKSLISKNVTNKRKTIAVRFPKHPITRSLLKYLKYPLAAPSANISSNISPVSKKDVEEEFGKKIKFILDGGQSSIGLESTILSLIKQPRILRLGGIEKCKINKFLKTRTELLKKSNIVMPGQEKLHYSPHIPIRLNVKRPRQSEAFILIKKRNFSARNYFYLTKNRNLKQAARNLYKILRLIKKKKFKYIAIENIPNIGFGEAINDRLMRASKY